MLGWPPPRRAFFQAVSNCRETDATEPTGGWSIVVSASWACWLMSRPPGSRRRVVFLGPVPLPGAIRSIDRRLEVTRAEAGNGICQLTVYVHEVPVLAL